MAMLCQCTQLMSMQPSPSHHRECHRHDDEPGESGSDAGVGVSDIGAVVQHEDEQEQAHGQVAKCEQAVHVGALHHRYELGSERGPWGWTMHG